MSNMQLQNEIQSLGPWFHNLHLPDGIETAPDHFLGDFPSFKWQEIAPHLPEDLSGMEALDIGCNAGFYTFELARRGARVTALDIDPHYLKQARWAAERLGLQDRVEFRQAAVYSLAQETKQYDLIWFMGVLYHLRHPLLALDIIRQRCKGQMIFQTMTAPGDEVFPAEADYGLHQRDVMNQPGWPKMAFIEHHFVGDPTNWWAANKAGVEAMLRSAGFTDLTPIGHEIVSCRAGKLNPMVEAELQSVWEGKTRLN